MIFYATIIDNVGSLNVLCIDMTIISLARVQYVCLTLRQHVRTRLVHVDACAVTSETKMASTSSNSGSCDAS